MKHLLFILISFFSISLIGQSNFHYSFYGGGQLPILASETIGLATGKEIKSYPSFQFKSKIRYLSDGKEKIYVGVTYNHIKSIKHRTKLIAPSDVLEGTKSHIISNIKLSYISVGIGKTFEINKIFSPSIYLSYLRHIDNNYEQTYYKGWKDTIEKENMIFRKGNFAIGVDTDISLYNNIKLSLGYEFIIQPYSFNFLFLDTKISNAYLMLGYQF